MTTVDRIYSTEEHPEATNSPFTVVIKDDELWTMRLCCEEIELTAQHCYLISGGKVTAALPPSLAEAIISKAKGLDIHISDHR